MAVDKNSKAYNSLRESGYTDEQIMKMHEEWLNGKSANEIINSSKQPERIDANVDQSKYDGTDWKWNITVWPRNANLNYYQYWDDSNPNQQWQKGWMNEKYTWEWVSNTYIEYNPDLTLADLDPNYLYWENARQQNRKEAGYIARRNDMIASALYNEWKVSREDVANFLSQQNEWMNSTEADRLNTIESVWKRLWQIKPEEYQPDLSKAEDIVKDTSGKIYWKTTAEEWNPKQWIDTLSDDNSVFKKMQEKQVKDVQDFVSQDYRNIATCIVEWTPYRSEQTWRDAQKYYPDFISLVNEEVKKQRTQQNVTAIASGWEMTTSAANWQSSANTEIANFWASNATWTKSSVEITKDVHNALAQNQTANEASETMASIEEDMAILKNRLKNLRGEANSKFKWDAPDYLVNAYMNNKAQEIQNQMQILEDRYNAAYTRYKTELAQTQWEKEYQLKQDQLQLERDELALKEYQVKNWLSTTSSKSTSATKNAWDSFEVTTKTDEEVSQAVDTLYDMFDNWQLGNAQCAAWIQTYYLPMLWITLPSLSSLERKKALINEDENYVPKRWDLIIINSGAKLEDWTPAWHIGIVLEVHKDWTVEYMDWNGKSNEKVAINGININSKSILWFRNVNKWQGQTSWWWTDYDYTRFEQYRDATSKSEKETIAAEYWTNVQWMNNIVRDALENRPESEQSSSQWEVGYDSELWFNTLHTDIYEQINQNKIDKSDMEWQAKRMWITEKELWRRADSYKLAKEKWLWGWQETWWSTWASSWWANYKWLTEEQLLSIEKEIGYNPNREDYYSDILTGKQKLPTTWPALENILGMTWAEDSRQLWKWIEHYRAKQKAIWLKAWDDILKLLAELQILYEDSKLTRDVTKDWVTKTIFDTTIWQWKWMWTIWIKYRQLMKQLLLNKVTEARNKWATFWSMTEYEWDILEDAASALKIQWTSTDEWFTDEFNKLVNAYWKLTQDTKQNITKNEWKNYVNKVRAENVQLQSSKSWVKNNAPKWNAVPNTPSWTSWGTAQSNWWKESSADW